eukprot:sb/3473084/
MQHPQYNKIAQIYSIIDITIIVLSSVVMVLESIKELETLPNFETTCEVIETAITFYFTVQAALLLAVFYSWKAYFKSVMNWVDILSILPFYFKFIATSFLAQKSAQTTRTHNTDPHTHTHCSAIPRCLKICTGVCNTQSREHSFRPSRSNNYSHLL